MIDGEEQVNVLINDKRANGRKLDDRLRQTMDLPTWKIDWLHAIGMETKWVGGAPWAHSSNARSAQSPFLSSVHYNLN